MVSLCRLGMLVVWWAMAPERAWPRVRMEARRALRHQPPLPTPWAHMSTQPEPHRVFHAAAGHDASRTPPIHAPGSGAASTHRKAALTHPKHWALATPRSAHDGLQLPGCECYGQVGLQASSCSLSVTVQACLVAVDQRPHAWATVEGQAIIVVTRAIISPASSSGLSGSTAKSSGPCHHVGTSGYPLGLPHRQVDCPLRPWHSKMVGGAEHQPTVDRA
jgi:hypothetical protein